MDTDTIFIQTGVDYDPQSKNILLIRCPHCGMENYAINVTLGVCTWCGFNAHKDETIQKIINDKIAKHNDSKPLPR